MVRGGHCAVSELRLGAEAGSSARTAVGTTGGAGGWRPWSGLGPTESAGRSTQMASNHTCHHATMDSQSIDLTDSCIP